MSTRPLLAVHAAGREALSTLGECVPLSPKRTSPMPCLCSLSVALGGALTSISGVVRVRGGRGVSSRVHKQGRHSPVRRAATLRARQHRPAPYRARAMRCTCGMTFVRACSRASVSVRAGRCWVHGCHGWVELEERGDGGAASRCVVGVPHLQLELPSQRSSPVKPALRTRTTHAHTL